MKRLRQLVENPDLAVALLVGVWGAWLGWVLTGPALLSAINWDQGAYIAWACAPGGHWSDPPWNAHFAIGHVYQLGVYMTKAFGGTVVDGFRLMDALAFGVAAGFMADAARRLSGNRWLGALLSLAWATTWVNLLFLLTLEDNVLYLPGAAALFWLIIARRERWTWRESVWAGVLAGWAALQSWQALYYLGPAGYAALWLAPRREKLRGGVIVTGAFFATLIGWCVLIAATSKLHLVDLVQNMFSRPTGSFSLSKPSLAFWGRILGLGFGWLATHTFVIAPPVKMPIERVGYAVMIVVTAVLIACTLVARKRGRWELHIIALSLFLFTLVTPLYHDLTEFRYIVRFDFWPLLFTLLGAAVLGELAPRPRLRAATAARASRPTRPTAPSTTSSSSYGRSWRTMARSHVTS